LSIESSVKGQVQFQQMGKDIKVIAEFTHLPPGEHGFHIHKAGDLSGDGCKKACDHFHYGNPSSHGGPPGHVGERHTGDLGNISLGPNGEAFQKEYLLQNLPIEELYGRSVIVHADPDDYGQGNHEDSKTTGHSGARIACGIIGRQDPCPAKGGKRGFQLFNDNPRGKSRLRGLGYGTRKKAVNSIRRLKKMPRAYQHQAATTMYYRAKYHKYRTRGMKNAMKLYGKYLKTLKQKKHT
jgi:Cu-Zn family superoxide dismutase